MVYTCSRIRERNKATQIEHPVVKVLLDTTGENVKIAYYRKLKSFVISYKRNSTKGSAFCYDNALQSIVESFIDNKSFVIIIHPCRH